MPVATQASLKGLTPEQLEDTGCRLCLNNTYHLYAAPEFFLSIVLSHYFHTFVAFLLTPMIYESWSELTKFVGKRPQTWPNNIGCGRRRTPAAVVAA